MHDLPVSAVRSSPRAAAAFLFAFVLSGCAMLPPFLGGDPPRPRMHALLLNGGGSKASNYASHLEHLKGVLEVLDEAGVERRDVVVFASDGDDPAPDLATRGAAPSSGLLQAAFGRPPIEFVNTEIEGIVLRPATNAALAEYFADEAADLNAGDTLLIYVTDHGTRGKDGPRSNQISLWQGERITVAEFEELIEEVPVGVRIVMLMSQCYSGGFAELAGALGQEGRRNGLCGYFSTTADRFAYGCYAESRGDAGVGHSIRFLEGLAPSGSFGDAHLHTLVNDHTPDVPLRTSDMQFRELLDAAANQQGLALTVYADQMLANAFRNPLRWESEIRLLDRIARSFGFASPRRLADIELRIDALPKVRTPLDEHAKAWDAARGDAEAALRGRFGVAHPDLQARWRPAARKDLPGAEADALQAEFASTFEQWLEADKRVVKRIDALARRARIARNVSYRMAVREAALVRLQAVLMQIAGTLHLEASGTAAEQQGFAALLACEDFSLPLSPQAAQSDRAPWPTYSGDIELAKQVLPAWMGIQFRQAPIEEREEFDLTPGAVSVRYVYEGSPAEAAGLQVGDIILGPPGELFVEPKQIREWTMFQEAGQARELLVLRAGERITLTLVPGQHPGKFPALPQASEVGDLAPELLLTSYRGELPTALVGRGHHLLFFWATWCIPCKAAVPEMMAWAEAQGVAVIAITDEDVERLDSFFAEWKDPFPARVARDPLRATTLAYGVSGTPTFVLVDEEGRVLANHTGYAKKKGLPLPDLNRLLDSAGPC
ncbi:MAG: redoxin family protein [Deltaproteobacteria bacterium]